MRHTETSPNRRAARMAVAILFVGIVVVLAVYFRLALHTDVVYAHFAYVPIILACMWWGRKGFLVAIPLAVLVLCFHALGLSAGHLSSDIVRASLLLFVAFLVSMLRERVTAGEEALRRSEARYRLLIEKSLAGILVYRGERTLYANARVTALTGYPPDQIIEMPVLDLVHDDDRRRVREMWLRCKEQGCADVHHECRLKTAAGNTVWVEVAASVSDFEGEPATLVHMYDITERKEAEAKRHELAELARRQEDQLVHSTRLAELGEMAAAIAHELNQPLTGIKNYARNASYMLGENAGTVEDVKTNLRLISEQVDRASRIISQMRELTRRSERQLAPVDINSAARESVEFLMPQFRLSGVELHLDLQEGLPQVMGDKVRLEQVLLNLLTNARQAMEESEERRLWVRTYFDRESDCPVVIEVQDTGIGFSEQDVEKLFRPFYSTKKAGHGTGLGLSISLSIVRDHKGRIEAAGEPGQGGKFTVRLPVPHGEPDVDKEHGDDRGVREE